MRGLLEIIFFPFMVSTKIWWILIIGFSFILIVKLGIDYQAAKLQAQLAGTMLEGISPYKLIKRGNYLILGILGSMILALIKEYRRIYKTF